MGGHGPPAPPAPTSLQYRKQDSKELSPRPLENAPKLLMLIKLFKLLVFYLIQNFNNNEALKTLDANYVAKNFNTSKALKTLNVVLKF